MLAEEEQLEDDEESIVITTKTTKVLDSSGRTKSITTETIKQLPDGSNIIETKTTNISRPTSRSSSLRNNSLTHPNNANYNLDKIEEDLQDFDYTYLDHEDRQAPPRLNNGIQDLPQSPRTLSYYQEQRNALAPAFQMPNKPEDRTASISSNQSPPKKLKSILKNSAGHSFSSPTDGPTETGSIDASSYKANHLSPRQGRSLPTELNYQASSVASGGASIKFRETVERISYPAEQHNLAEILRADSLKKEKEKQKNVDLYSQAMKVAMEKVYGRTSEDNANFHTPPESPVLGENPKKELNTLAEQKLKKDSKRGESETGGVNKNYIYENHHRGFPVHSMRDGGRGNDSSTTTRKERAKEEKKNIKEENKRTAELLKTAEKERKKEEKSLKKKEKKPFSLFGRKRRQDSIGTDSVFSGSQTSANEVYSHQVTPTQPPAKQTFGTSPYLVVTPETHVTQTPPVPAIQNEVGTSELSPINNPTSEFVDVPDIVEDKDVPSYVGVHGQESSDIEPTIVSHDAAEVQAVPPRTDLTSVQTEEPTIPPRADITAIQVEDPEIPPRADLDVLNSGSPGVEQIPEEQLPTLVADADNYPHILVDKAFDNEADNTTSTKAADRYVTNSDLNNALTQSTPERQAFVVPTEAAPVLRKDQLTRSKQEPSSPEKIAKPQLRVLDDPASAEPLDLLADEFDASESADESEIRGTDAIQQIIPGSLAVDSSAHAPSNVAAGGSAASEESEQTLHSEIEPTEKAEVVGQAPNTTIGKSAPLHTANAAEHEKEFEKEIVALPEYQTVPPLDTTGPTGNISTKSELTPVGVTNPVEAQPVDVNKHVLNPDATYEQSATYDDVTQTPDATFASEDVYEAPTSSEKHTKSTETEAKHKPKKRILRFKKMIDKYFINSYSN